MAREVRAWTMMIEEKHTLRQEFLATVDHNLLLKLGLGSDFVKSPRTNVTLVARVNGKGCSTKVSE